MASDSETSCVSDPNFAVICSFLEKFAKSCGITHPNILELQEMLENSQEVPQPLIDLHVKLLRKARKSVSGERWEKAIIKFCHSYSNQDGWEIERFGYKKARIGVKLRILKMLLEIQFDLNTKFKTEVNRLSADELRCQPLGRDKMGQTYWCQLDEDCNLRVYREDLDDETWEIVASDREELVQLISQLSSNDPFRKDTEALLNEDSNSLEMEKPITDTGQTIAMPSSATEPFDDEEFHEIEDDEEDGEASELMEGNTLNGSINTSVVNGTSKYQQESEIETAQESSSKCMPENNEDLPERLNKESLETILSNVSQRSALSESGMLKPVSADFSENQSVSDTSKGKLDSSVTSNIQLPKVELLKEESLSIEVINKQVKEVPASDESTVLALDVQGPAIRQPDLQAPPVQLSDLQAPAMLDPAMQAPPMHVQPIQTHPIHVSPILAPSVQVTPIQAPVQVPPIQAQTMLAPVKQAPAVVAPPVLAPPGLAQPMLAPHTQVPPVLKPNMQGQETGMELSTEVVLSKEVSTKEVPIKDVPIKEMPIKEVPIKEVPIKEVPIKEVSTKEVSTKEVPMKEMLNKEVLTKEVPGKEVLTKEVPTKEVPTKEVPTKEVPTREVPTKEVPIKEVPTKEVPIKEVSAKEVPTKAVSTKEVPTKAVSTKEALAKEVPIKEVPTKEVPIKEVSAKEVPTKAVSTKEVPTKAVSTKEALAKEVLAKEVSAKEVSTKHMSPREVSKEAKEKITGAMTCEEGKELTVETDMVLKETSVFEMQRKGFSDSVTKNETCDIESSGKQSFKFELSKIETNKSIMTPLKLVTVEQCQSEPHETKKEINNFELLKTDSSVKKQASITTPESKSSAMEFHEQKIAEKEIVLPKELEKTKSKVGISHTVTQISHTVKELPVVSQASISSVTSDESTKSMLFQNIPPKFTPDQILLKEGLPQSSFTKGSEFLSSNKRIESSGKDISEQILSKSGGSESFLLAKTSHPLVSVKDKSDILKHDISDIITPPFNMSETASAMELLQSAFGDRQPQFGITRAEGTTHKREVFQFSDKPKIKLSQNVSSKDDLLSKTIQSENISDRTKLLKKDSQKVLSREVTSTSISLNLMKTKHSEMDKHISLTPVKSDLSENSTKNELIGMDLSKTTRTRDLEVAHAHNIGIDLSSKSYVDDQAFHPLDDNGRGCSNLVAEDLSGASKRKVPSMENFPTSHFSVLPLTATDLSTKRPVTSDLIPNTSSIMGVVPEYSSLPINCLSMSGKRLHESDLLANEAKKLRLEKTLAANCNKPIPTAAATSSYRKDHFESEQSEEVGEAIEEPLMLVRGEGSGADCETGNSGKDGDAEKSCGAPNKEQMSMEKNSNNPDDSSKISNGDGDKNVTSTESTISNLDSDCGINEKSSEMSLSKPICNFPVTTKASDSKFEIPATFEPDPSPNQCEDALNNEEKKREGGLETKEERNLKDGSKASHFSNLSKTKETLVTSTDPQQFSEKGTVKGDDSPNKNPPPKLWSIDTICAAEHDKAKIGSKQSGSSLLGVVSDSLYGERYNVSCVSSNSPTKRPSRWDVENSDKSGKKIEEPVTKSNIFEKETSGIMVGDSRKEKNVTKLADEDPNSLLPGAVVADLASSDKNSASNKPSSQVCQKQKFKFDIENIITNFGDKERKKLSLTHSMTDIKANTYIDQLQVPEAVTTCVDKGVASSDKPDPRLEGSISPKRGEEEKIPDNAKRKSSDMQVKGFFFGPGCLMKSPIKKTESNRTVTEEEVNQASSESRLHLNEENQLIIAPGCTENDENDKSIKQKTSEDDLSILKSVPSNTAVSSNLEPTSKAKTLHSIDTIMLSPHKPPNLTDANATPTTLSNATDNTNVEKGNVQDSKYCFSSSDEKYSGITKSKRDPVSETKSDTLTHKPEKEGTANIISDSGSSLLISKENPKAAYVKGKPNSGNIKSINSGYHLPQKEGGMKGKEIPGDNSANNSKKENETACKEVVNTPVSKIELLKTNEDTTMQSSASLTQLIDDGIVDQKSLPSERNKVQSKEIDKRIVMEDSTDNKLTQKQVIDKPLKNVLVEEVKKEEQTDISIIRNIGGNDSSECIIPDLKKSKNSDAGDSGDKEPLGDKEPIICAKSNSSGDMGKNSTGAGSSCIKTPNPSISEASVSNMGVSRKTSGSIVTEKSKSGSKEEMVITSKNIRDVKTSKEPSDKEVKTPSIEESTTRKETIKLVETNVIQGKKSENITESSISSKLTVNTVKSINIKDIQLEAASDSSSEILNKDSTPSKKKEEVTDIFSSKSECKADTSGPDVKISSISFAQTDSEHRSAEGNPSRDTAVISSKSLCLSTQSESKTVDDSIVTSSDVPTSIKESSSNSKEDKSKKVEFEEFVVDKSSDFPKLCTKTSQNEPICAAMEGNQLKEDNSKEDLKVTSPSSTHVVTSSTDIVNKNKSIIEISLKSNEVDKDFDKNKIELSQVCLEESKMLPLKEEITLEEKGKFSQNPNELDNSLILVKNSEVTKNISKDFVDNEYRKKLCATEARNILEISKDVECEKPKGLSDIQVKMQHNQVTMSVDEIQNPLDLKECSQKTNKKDVSCDQLKSVTEKSHQNIPAENEKNNPEINCNESSTKSLTTKTSDISSGKVENPTGKVETSNHCKPTVSIDLSASSEEEKVCEISSKSQSSLKDSDPLSKSPTGKSLSSSFSKSKNESHSKARRKSLESISMGIMMGKVAAKSSLQEPSAAGTGESLPCSEEPLGDGERLTEVQQPQINVPDSNYLLTAGILKESPNEKSLQNICEISEPNNGKTNTVLQTSSNSSSIKEIETLKKPLPEGELTKFSAERDLSSSQEMIDDNLNAKKEMKNAYPVDVIKIEENSDSSKDSSDKVQDHRKKSGEEKEGVVDIEEKGKGPTKSVDIHKRNVENSDKTFHGKSHTLDQKQSDGKKEQDSSHLKDNKEVNNQDDSMKYENSDTQKSIVIANEEEKEILTESDKCEEANDVFCKDSGSKEHSSLVSEVTKPLPINTHQLAEKETLSITSEIQSSNNSSVCKASKKSDEIISDDSNVVTSKKSTDYLTSDAREVSDRTPSKLDEPDILEKRQDSSLPTNSTQTKIAEKTTSQTSNVEEKDSSEHHKNKECGSVESTDAIKEMTSDSEPPTNDNLVAQNEIPQSEVESSSKSNEKNSTLSIKENSTASNKENSVKMNKDRSNSNLMKKEGDSVIAVERLKTKKEETTSKQESCTPSVIDKSKEVSNSISLTDQPNSLKKDSNSVTESSDVSRSIEKSEPSLDISHAISKKAVEPLDNETKVKSVNTSIKPEKNDIECEGDITNESHNLPGESCDDVSDKVSLSSKKEEDSRKSSITRNKTSEIIGAVSPEDVDSKGKGEASSSEGDDRVGDPAVNSEGESEVTTERPSRLSMPTRGMRGRGRGRGRGGWRGRGRMPRAATYTSPALPETPAKDEGHSSAGSTPSKRKRGKRAPKLLGLDVGVDIVLEQSKEADDKSGPPVRQSRRIAQMKIREEAERRKLEEMTLQQLKAEQSRRRADIRAEKKEAKEGKKRKKKYIESDEDFTAEEVDEEISKKKLKKKKKRRKKKPALSFNESHPWKSSSGSSTSQEEEEEVEQTEEEEEDDEELVFKSDHEFSPESDLENDATEITPTKRARTAQKGQLCAEDEEEPADEHACQKCGKSDHPEWILLCDKCDAGWHGSCLRPALMVIPEGDWFCPPCEHTFLLQNLHNSLLEFDRNWKKRENEELRRKRLAYVGISLDNVLPNKEKEGSEAESDPEGKKEPKAGSLSGSETSGSDSGSGSSGDESEPVYQLRERRQTLFSYRFNEYDDLINSAIQDEMEAVKGAGNQGRGKDISTIVKAEAEEKQAAAQKQEEENMEKRDLKDEEELQMQAETIPEEIPHVVPKHEIKDDDEEEDDFCPFKKFQTKKKHRRLNSLDISSEDDAESDEDFKGSSSDDEEEEYEEASDAESDDSEFAGRRKKGRRSSGPVRRSSRARITRFDKEFINDDSEDSEPPKKKSRKLWQDSESEDSDASWGRSKKPKKYIPTFKPKEKKKKKKRSKRSLDSDLETFKTKKPKIKYGGLDDEDDEVSPTRRTRGRKINYQEFAASESEEETWGKTRKLDSEDEYVANEEEEDEEEEEVVPDFDKDSDNDSGGEPSDKKKVKSKHEKKGKSKKISKNLAEKGSRRGKKPGKPKKKLAIESDDPDPPDDIEEPEPCAEVNNSHETVMNTTEPETDASVVPISTLPSVDIPKEKRGRTRGQGKKVEDQKKKTRRKKRGDIDEDLLDPEIEKDLCQEGFSGQQISDVLLPPQTRRSGDAARKTNEALMKRLSANRTTIHIKSAPEVSDVDQTQGSKSLMEADPLRTLLAAPPVIPTESEVKVNEDISPPVGRRKGRGRGKAGAVAEVSKTQDVGHYPLQSFPTGTASANNNSSVITRMLQAQPVSNAPQSFTAAAAAMGHKYFGNSSGESPMIPMAGRGAPAVQPFPGSPKGLQSQYRQPPPLDPNNPALASGMSHFGSSPAGRGSNVRAPPPNFPQTAAMRMRNPSPGNQSHLFHTSHHPMDPSPSGGGPIIISSSGAAPPPPSGSPLTTKPGTPSTSHSTPTPPPPPYSRPGSQMPLAPPASTSMASMVPFPMQPGESQPPGRHTPSSFSPASSSHLQSPQGAQQSPPPPPPHQGRSPVPGNFSPYHPPPPANYHYGGYPPPPPMSAADDALPPSAFQGSPYTDHYTSEMTANLQASDGSNSKSYEEEAGGEFGGLVSYFSSQREDDLDT